MNQPRGRPLKLATRLGADGPRQSKQDNHSGETTAGKVRRANRPEMYCGCVERDGPCSPNLYGPNPSGALGTPDSHEAAANQKRRRMSTEPLNR